MGQYRLHGSYSSQLIIEGFNLGNNVGDPKCTILYSLISCSIPVLGIRYISSEQSLRSVEGVGLVLQSDQRERGVPVGVSNGMVGVSNGLMGVSYGLVGVSYGMVGVSNGLMGVSYGLVGVSYGMVGVSYGLVGVSYGLVGVSNGLVGVSYYCRIRKTH